VNEKHRILLVGLTNKAGLAVARNLSKSGCIVDVVLFTDVAARHSRFVNKSYHLGNPAYNVDLFVIRLSELLRNCFYDALLPVTDGALEICRNYKKTISSLVKIVGLNADSAYLYSKDKSALLDIGIRNGLTIPKGILIRNFKDFNKCNLDAFEFPVIAKPVSSALIINNKLISFSVRICHNINELTDFIRETVNCVPILIQEYIEGYGIGYNFISRDGIVLNAYIHRRLIEDKGVSTLRESLPSTTYSIENDVIKIVKEINWNGVGMLEFKIDSNNQPVLMEFNGRFFGSTELSVKAGINLPLLFFDSFVLDKTIERNIIVRNVVVRFLHDEFMLKAQGLFKLRIKDFISWLVDLLLSVFSKNHYIEDSIIEDPGFSIALWRYEIKRWCKGFYTSLRAKLFKINPLTKCSLKNVNRVCFVCYGNICRSPFAFEYAKNLNNNYTFDSLGFIEIENRMSPAFALLTAKEFNVDLTSHQSKSIYSIDTNEVDLFVVMDRMNYLKLRHHGVPESKIRFLSNKEIKDPYGGTLDDYLMTYNKIKVEIDNIFG